MCEFGELVSLTRSSSRRPEVVRALQAAHAFCIHCVARVQLASDSTGSRWDANISHDKKLVAAAVSTGRVGVDISSCTNPGRLQGTKNYLAAVCCTRFTEHVLIASTGSLSEHISKYFGRVFCKAELDSILSFGGASSRQWEAPRVPVLRAVGSQHSGTATEPNPTLSATMQEDTRLLSVPASGEVALVHAFRWHWAAKEAVLKVCPANAPAPRRRRTLCMTAGHRSWLRQRFGS